MSESLTATPEASLLGAYWTEPELAAQIKRTIRTVQRWRYMGEGPPCTIIGDKTPVYRIAAVQKWLLEQERAPVRERHVRRRLSPGDKRFRANRHAQAEA